MEPLFAVSNGIGLTSDVAYVKAFDLRDGKQLWKFDIPVRRDAPAPGGGKGCPWGSQLSVVGSNLFFGSCSGDVHMLQLQSGRRVWSTNVSRWPMSSAPTVVAGTVYIGGVNTVAALDARTGQVRWKVRRKYVWRTILRRGILIADTGTRMAALDAKTGKMLWSTRQERTDLQAHGDHLYECYPAHGDPSYLKVRSLTTGKVTQRFKVRCLRLLIRGDIIVASNLKAVFALNRKTGKQLWSRRAHRKVGIAVVQDRVLISSADKLIAANILTGKQHWTFASAHGILEPTNPVTPPLLHDQSNLCFSTSQGWVYCLGAAGSR